MVFGSFRSVFGSFLDRFLSIFLFKFDNNENETSMSNMATPTPRTLRANAAIAINSMSAVEQQLREHQQP